MTEPYQIRNTAQEPCQIVSVDEEGRQQTVANVPPGQTVVVDVPALEAQRGETDGLASLVRVVLDRVEAGAIVAVPYEDEQDLHALRQRVGLEAARRGLLLEQRYGPGYVGYRLRDRVTRVPHLFEAILDLLATGAYVRVTYGDARRRRAVVQGVAWRARLRGLVLEQREGRGCVAFHCAAAKSPEETCHEPPR